MKLLIVGGGGREAAIIKTLLRTSHEKIDTVYVLPGNGGIALIDRVECVDIKAINVAEIVRFALERSVDFVVVAPDDPLVIGAVDALEAAGIPAFGPSKAAARIEGSKSFAKDLMKKYNIPTASYEVFETVSDALSYVHTCPIPIVVKADGLALGKGVTVALDRDTAVAAVLALMEDKTFGAAGSKIVIEEYMTGPEVSLLCFCDGETVIPMVSSMDHKRAFDGGKGPNTGGMGTIAPNPFYTKSIAERTLREIIYPIVDAMKKEGCPFKGCLYAGLMITPTGPRVIEFNCRFGDPETQVVLPLLEGGDLLAIMRACHNGTLDNIKDTIHFSNDAACCVVLCSDGYPTEYKTGFPLTIPDDNTLTSDYIFVAGAKTEADGSLLTSGGRVVGATAVRGSLREAIAAAYALAESVRFENKFCRGDIGRGV